MRSAATLAAAALLAASAGAFIPARPVPLSRVRAAATRSHAIRMDTGEGAPKLTKVEALKVCTHAQ